jgi:RNA polymerase sigma-70 factor (ECF subfamily)
VGRASVSRSEPLSRRELADIYNTYGSMMRRRCRIVLKDDALGDDAFQDAFVNLIKYGANFRQAEAKLRWLYRLCDRCCFAVIEKRKRGKIREQAYVDPVPTAPAARIEDRDAVIKILGALDDKARTIAVLAYVDGLSQAEIGSTLGWSRQTINKKLRQVREAAGRVMGGIP